MRDFFNTILGGFLIVAAGVGTIACGAGCVHYFIEALDLVGISALAGFLWSFILLALTVAGLWLLGGLSYED